MVCRQSVEVLMAAQSEDYMKYATHWSIAITPYALTGLVSTLLLVIMAT